MSRDTAGAQVTWQTLGSASHKQLRTAQDIAAQILVAIESGGGLLNTSNTTPAERPLVCGLEQSLNQQQSRPVLVVDGQGQADSSLAECEAGMRQTPVQKMQQIGGQQAASLQH
ncbi:hypothetical protein WJX74_001451 [Apatococcus lobatus]|uniref:Uncharacterized protein n=1 Tax=Apatococcus lobatus TaxID=904363 RepID=A0AAW1SA81_9CHLO